MFTYRKADVDKVLSCWKHEEAAKQARITLDRYGVPDEVTSSMLRWYHRGPWKRIEVQDMHLLHNFPVPHYDFISHVAPYKVNVDKASDCKRSWRGAQKFMYDAITRNSHPEYINSLQFQPPSEQAAHNPSLPYPEQAKARGKAPE